jgi:hypothetical protein
VANGATATVAAVDPATSTITVHQRNDHDETTTVIPADYLQAGQVAHGYATTIHKAQGATVDQAFLLGSDNLYREAGYTGLSRARQGTNLYLVAPPTPAGQMGRHDMVDPVMELAARLGVSRTQLLAADQLPPPPPARPARGPARPLDELAGDAHQIAAALADQAPPPGADPHVWVAQHWGDLDRWRGLQATVTAQRHALGVAALYDPAPHLIDALGPPPAAGVDRHRWAVTAGRVEAYRAAHRIDDPAGLLGPEPDHPAEVVEWRHVARAVEQFQQRHLDQGLSL